jgi:hypothetical protein
MTAAVNDSNYRNHLWMHAVVDAVGEMRQECAADVVSNQRKALGIVLNLSKGPIEFTENAPGGAGRTAPVPIQSFSDLRFDHGLKRDETH